MDKLAALSNIVKGIYLDVAADQERSDFIFFFRSILKVPLIRYNEAYGTFISSVAKTPDTFDLWINIQMRVLTALGADADTAIAQLAKMFKDVLNTTEGGDIMDATDADDFKRYSFMISLAFRIYLDDFPQALAEAEPPSTGPAQ